MTLGASWIGCLLVNVGVRQGLGIARCPPRPSSHSEGHGFQSDVAGATLSPQK